MLSHFIRSLLSIDKISWKTASNNYIQYSLKINELIQILKQEFSFSSSTLAKNTSVWVNYTFCVSSKFSCKYTISARVFASHIWVFNEKQHSYTACLHISRFSSLWRESVADWLTHFASIRLRRPRTRVRFPWWVWKWISRTQVLLHVV